MLKVAAACMVIFLASFLTARAAIIEDPFADPDATAGATGCVQAHLHKVGFDAGPIDNQYGRSTLRAATRLREALVPFHAESGTDVPLPNLSKESAEIWCMWFEAHNPTTEATYILYEVNDRLLATNIAIITQGQAAEVRMA